MGDLEADIPKLKKEIRDLGEDVEVIDVEVAIATAAPAVEAAESVEKNRGFTECTGPPGLTQKAC